MQRTLSENIQEFGLSKGEADVYLALLRAGKSTVKSIKDLTDMQRTGIYDFLDKLLQKGLVSYSVERNIRYYSAVSPEKFELMVEEKKILLTNIMPSLVQLKDQSQQDLSVELAHGSEGIKNFLHDIIRTNKDYVCINVDEEEWEKKFPYITAQHMKKEKVNNIKWRAIVKEKSEFVYQTPQATYRFLAQEHFGPTNTIIYGENIAIVVHEPLTVITIRNKSMAQAYKRHFEFLWSIAKE